jgi:hypothetical protein
LFLLQPEFKKPMEKREPTWANEVVRLREAFYQNKADRQQIMKEELQYCSALRPALEIAYSGQLDGVTSSPKRR